MRFGGVGPGSSSEIEPRCDCAMSKSAMASRPKLASRFLLRDAMERAEAPNQFRGIDADDTPIRYGFLQNLQSAVIIGMAKGRKQHNSVRHVEVRVARGKPLPPVLHHARHRQFNNSKRLARLIAQGAETLQIVLENREVRIRAVRFHHRYARGRIDKAG